MAVPIDKELYEKVKEIVYKQYSKPSAYRSGALVKLYKSMGGRYKDDNNKEKPLADWFKADWININPNEKGYPVYRPTKRINKDTPLTIDEIDSKNLKEQIKLKQRIKGTKNLKPFKKK